MTNLALSVAAGMLTIALMWLSLLLLSGIRWKRLAMRVRRGYINLDNRDKQFLQWYGRAWYVFAMLMLWVFV